MITLGIETSCDETAVALYDSDKGLIGEAVFSQIELHGEYGGVINVAYARHRVRQHRPGHHRREDGKRQGAVREQLPAVRGHARRVEVRGPRHGD